MISVSCRSIPPCSLLKVQYLRGAPTSGYIELVQSAVLATDDIGQACLCHLSECFQSIFYSFCWLLPATCNCSFGNFELRKVDNCLKCNGDQRRCTECQHPSFPLRLGNIHTHVYRIHYILANTSTHTHTLWLHALLGRAKLYIYIILIIRIIFIDLPFIYIHLLWKCRSLQVVEVQHSILGRSRAAPTKLRRPETQFPHRPVEYE